MNWEAIGAVGEILGAIAVLFTLIYLAFQVRQNVKLTKALIRESRTDSSHRVLSDFREESELLFKETNLTEPENFRLEMIYRALFRDWEAYAYQHDQGLLEESEWDPIREAQKNVFKNEIARKTWAQVKPSYSILLQEKLQDVIYSNSDDA